MKLTLSFILLFGLNAKAQSNFFIEYNFSNLFSFDNLVLDNSLSVGFKKNKVFSSFQVGREDWNLLYFSDNNYYKTSSYNTHCRTYKIAALLEYQFSIPKTKLSIRVGGGAKVYFLNQMKDSLSLLGNYLHSLKPKVLLNAPDNISDPFKNKGLYYFSFITSVPYALTTNLAVQYNFKKYALKIYFEPYLMFVQYKNSKNFTRGSTFIYYNNIGLGINYPLNFKKKDQKVTEIE